MMPPIHNTIVLRTISNPNIAMKDRQIVNVNLNKIYNSDDALDHILDRGDAPRKRRRLTHLTTEEKLLRRKLKNRVAAQTARDRKKALMSELEERIVDLEEDNKALLAENATLRLQSGLVSEENKELRLRLGMPVVDLSCVKKEPECMVSAVPDVPQQKGRTPVLSRTTLIYAAWLLMMMSLSIFSTFYTTSNDRTRAKPNSRTSAMSQKSVKASPNLRWWGPHQHNWTPSETM